MITRKNVSIFSFLGFLGLFLFFSSGASAQSLSLEDRFFLNPQTSKTISMDFKDAALNDVLKIFSQQSGLNFIAEQEVIEKKITLFLDKVPVEQALEKILSANNLTYEIQADSNIFIVKSLGAPVKELVTRVYYLKNATVQSSKFNATINIEDEEDSEGTSNQNTMFGSTGQAENGVASALKTILSESGKIVEDPRTNSIIVTDIPSQFPLIEQTIARLDVPVSQILIETEMLDVSKDNADKLGIKFGDTPLTFTGGERDHVYPWNQNNLLRKGFAFEEAEYRVGTISAAGLSATLQFLRTQTDTKNLARPRILTLNNQTAQIKISTNEAIGVQTVTDSAQSNATTTVEAERVQTGVFLTVTPQANLTTREITMAIAPRVIQARSGATFEGKTFKDPEERGTKSILRVQDGDTIILGGLLRTDLTNTTTKVPVLGDIPIVGAAFRHKDKSDIERELIIFITPHIVSDATTAKLALTTNPQDIVREQDVPESRRQQITDTLKRIENQR
ncbi:MAG: secretin N-terminal domain-containing protein [Candidatus Omnitrophota bacterium]